MSFCYRRLAANMSASRSLPQDRVVDFGDGHKPIVVQYRNAKRYYKCKHYNESPGLNWIEFCVQHEGVLNFTARPQELILNALFDVVQGEQFFPVDYQSGSFVDSFLVRACKPALDKFFQNGLRIKVATGAELHLVVWFNVAENNRSQISPAFLISKLIDRQLDRLEHYMGVQGVLNLSNFSANPYFRNFIVRLSNTGTFQLVCSTVNNNDDRRRAVKGFNLAHNQLTDLGPLRLFGDVDYGLLDLTGNKLTSAKRLCSDLQRFRAKQLNLANNPIVKSPKYPDCLKPLMANFEIVDGVPFDKLYKTYTPLNYEIDVECDGVRIDWTNKSKVAQFKDSQDWHAFLIPDLNHEFTKDDLFNYFFILISPELSEFYPCYYKYDGGEHRFLVRDCHDQIEHLVHNCNLEMKIPQLVAAGDIQDFSYQRSIAFYLRMNVSTLKQGHVQPKQCIEQAIQKRFVAVNRLLNLEQFQNTDGLENVIVRFSSPKILSSILRTASRKFLGNCVDLRLCNNKILGLNNLRTLSLLSSLQALDLGHNWIYELSQISALSEVPLKSLRLHGNPVCRKYSLPSEYIKAVKEICPGLQRLDDVDLSSKPGLAPQKNFLCDTAAYELTSDLFLYPFLREFEQSDQRCNLSRYYDDNSIFTLTCSYDMRRSKQPSNELYKRINKYNYFSRNLLKNSRDTCRIHVGGHDIMMVLMQLPEVTHDYVSLQTDVMHYDSQKAVIYVNGVLRDEPDLMLAFSRHFVLKVDAVGLGVGKRARRLKIVNEHLSIMNPSPRQLKDAFKFGELPADQAPQKDDDTVDVKEHKLLIFQELTGLRPKWCTRIVQEEANWDFQLALEQFLRMESDNELPDSAFI